MCVYIYYTHMSVGRNLHISLLAYPDLLGRLQSKHGADMYYGDLGGVCNSPNKYPGTLTRLATEAIDLQTKSSQYLRPY